jgi:hypothetical protein
MLKWSFAAFFAISLFAGIKGRTQQVIPAIDTAEPIGARPYEMVRAGREEPAPPTVTFANLQGWTMQVSGHAQAVLQASRAENVWKRPAGELRYKGDGNASANPKILLTPPKPVLLPPKADSVDMWVYGNRWDFENPPDTPPVSITILLKGQNGAVYRLPIASVGWQQWWLLHCSIPVGVKNPLVFTGLEISNGWQSDWRKIYLDSIRFYHEGLGTLHFRPLPHRNLILLPGQSPGANTGIGKLPFPTRAQTILPVNRIQNYQNQVKKISNAYVFQYHAKDCDISYTFNPAIGLSGITALINGKYAGRLLDGARVEFTGSSSVKPSLYAITQDKKRVTATYRDGTTLRMTIWQKSLVIDVINRTGNAASLQFGCITGLTAPRTIYVPFLTWGNDAGVLLSRAGSKQVYTTIWPDWYRSNGSRFISADYVSGNTAKINGGVLYSPLTNGKRNPMYERLFITVSPSIEEVLPVIANPVGLHAKEAVDRLWQESWGPSNYAQEENRCDMLRAYGIKKLIQCNHELTWRDFGESFTLRTHAAPGRGGDVALQKYVAHQQSLGWLSGLYTNYSDFAPVNRHWNPDFVIRNPDGNWAAAWPRCWALKPLAAVQLDAALVPVIEKRYHSNAAYTDVMTAVSPFDRTDFDARVPGAGSFAQTFYAYGQLLRNDSTVYKGPVFSEGTYQYLYAGLDDGNYGHVYNNRPLATSPLLPVFDLMQIHPKECDIGVSWTSSYCGAIPNWQSPLNLDHSIDRFLLTTMAYGHIGWLVEEQYGIERTCRSYYMLQQVQARYGLKAPNRIAYWDGKRLRDVSDAVELGLPQSRRQLYIEYPNGLTLWLNDSPDLNWRIKVNNKEVILPPAGWAVFQQKGALGPLLSSSALHEGKKTDYLRSNEYTYIDGRGQWFQEEEAGSNGAMDIEPGGRNILEIIHISGNGTFEIGRPYNVQGVALKCKSYDIHGVQLQNALIHDSGTQTWIEPVPNAIRYILQFSGKPAWSLRPAVPEASPGSRVALILHDISHAQIISSSGSINGNILTIPAKSAIGSWISITAKNGNTSRETKLHIVAPVTWQWQSVPSPDVTSLILTPAWHLSGIAHRIVTLHIKVTDGWQISPQSIRFSSTNPPHQFTLSIRSEKSAGEKGTFTLSLDGLTLPSAAIFELSRITEQALIHDLSAAHSSSWGICLRGQSEKPDSGVSGAIFSPVQDLSVGGVTKHGIFMHPPYQQGVGYTWETTEPIHLPGQPAQFRSFIGIRDGGDQSDGVVFSVDVIDSKGHHVTVASKTGVQHEWRLLEANLSKYAGQTVRLELKADVGPQNNSTADWASWGEPGIFLLHPPVVTMVSATEMK